MSKHPYVLAGTLVAAGIALSPAGWGVEAGGRLESGGERSGLVMTENRWGPVVRLARNPRDFSVAVDASNRATVVWTANSGLSVMAVRRSAGGRWGAPRLLGGGHSPQVAVDGRGTVTVAWISSRPGWTDGVVTVRKRLNRPWSSPRRLSVDLKVPGYPSDGEEAYGAESLDVAVTMGGSVTAAWNWGSDSRHKAWRIRSAHRPAGGRWSEQQEVAPPSAAKDPHLGVANDGGVLLMYARQPLGQPRMLVARHRPAGGGTWSKASVVASEGYGESLGVDRAGNAVVAFTPDFTHVWTRSRTPNGRWQHARRLSRVSDDIADFAVDVNPRGTAAAVLGHLDGRVEVRRRPLGASWSAPVELSPKGADAVSEVMVALDGRGDTFVGWGSYGVYGRYAPRSQPWGGAFRISSETGADVLEATQVVVEQNGDVLVVWDQEDRPLKARSMRSTSADLRMPTF